MTKAAARTPSTTSTSAAGIERSADRDRIAQRAHEIYVSRGGEHGQDLDDWLQAERELESRGAPGNGNAGSRARRPAARSRKKAD